MSRSLIITVTCGFVLLAVIGVLMPEQEKKQPASQVTKKAGVFQETCATCHGDQGQGNREKMTPSIAALPRWYLEEQIRKFRNGRRGAHPEDLHGQQMQAAISVLNEEQISEALDTVESLPFPSSEVSLKGDEARGAILYREHCMECHRYNGKGEVAFLSSPVAGLQDWYLLDQWNKFSQGVRGYHADDESGPKMRKATGYLANEQEILDVIRFITTLPKEK